MQNNTIESFFDFTFEAMGTNLQIRIFEQKEFELNRTQKAKIKLDIINFTYLFDETYSRFKPNSLVSQISERANVIEKIPLEFMEILKIYSKLNSLTNGALNPLIGNTISDLGYDENHSLKKKETVRHTPNFKDTLEFIDHTRIRLNEKVLIDIGAIGKGYWCEKVKEILIANNFKKFFINGSGDIYYVDNKENKTLKVDIVARDINLGYTTLESGMSICGSGIEHRNWGKDENENLHHVIDANTNLPTSNIVSTWVKASNCALADGLATALFFVEPEVLLKEYKFEYIVVDKNKKTSISEGFCLTTPSPSFKKEGN